MPTDTILSIDVDNIFTNVPHAETISINLNNFYNQSDTFMSMTHEIFKNVFELSVKSYFFFVGNNYR